MLLVSQEPLGSRGPLIGAMDQSCWVLRATLTCRSIFVRASRIMSPTRAQKVARTWRLEAWYIYTCMSTSANNAAEQRASGRGGAAAEGVESGLKTVSPAPIGGRWIGGVRCHHHHHLLHRATTSCPAGAAAACVSMRRLRDSTAVVVDSRFRCACAEQ